LKHEIDAGKFNDLCHPERSRFPSQGEPKLARPLDIHASQMFVTRCHAHFIGASHLSNQRTAYQEDQKQNQNKSRSHSLLQMNRWRDYTSPLMHESIMATLSLGFLLGLKHATEADHLAAVSTIVSERRSIWQAATVGLLWGAGHTA